MKRPRYVARDYEEAKQYLEGRCAGLQKNFIPGGIDAVAGGDMNFDESTPHIHFQADTFSPKPEDPDKLRCRPASRTTLTPRAVHIRPKKGKQISGNQKFIDAQRGLREHMHSLGYPVELEVSERHDESLNLDRYTEQQDREARSRQARVMWKSRSDPCSATWTQLIVTASRLLRNLNRRKKPAKQPSAYRRMLKHRLARLPSVCSRKHREKAEQDRRDPQRSTQGC